MCTDNSYNDLPSVTIGGPPGDYLLPPSVPSNQFLEYKVVSAFSSGATTGIVQVSGTTKPFPIDTSGATIYNGENNNVSIRAVVIPIGPTTNPPLITEWEVVSSPNMHIFVRIDGVTAGFVTIKQRVKILTKVPGPFTTVHPDNLEDMNVAREERILQAVYGTEGVAIEYGRKPEQAGTVRTLETGPQPVYPERGWPFRPRGNKPGE